MDNLLFIGVYPHLTCGQVSAYQLADGKHPLPCADVHIACADCVGLREIADRYTSAVAHIKQMHAGVDVYGVALMARGKFGSQCENVKIADQSRLTYLLAGHFLATEPDVNIATPNTINGICDAFYRPVPDHEQMHERWARQSAYALMCIFMHEAILIGNPEMRDL
jgi:hypothetical protein